MFGKAGGFASNITLATMTAADGFRIQGDAAFDRTGFSVRSAGDINGDGIADIIVSADLNDRGGNFAGAAYVIFGRTTGFGAVIDLTDLPASTGFRIQGDSAQDQAGVAVSTAGDINGDGFDDLIVGAPNNANGGVRTGAAYVLFGHAGGFGDLIDLTDLNPGIGFKIAGEQADDYAGLGVSAAGDINGDGFDDIIVGAYNNDGGGTNAGAAYVIFGRNHLVIPDALPSAAADTGATSEGVAAIIAVLTNDTDTDGGPKQVGRINGITIDVGTSVTIASGAIVTRNADGTLTYNSNGKFDWLTSATRAATNPAYVAQATDSFVYALNGGSTATVTVTITGVDGAGDQLRGTAGADSIIGTAGDDLINLSFGASDIATGGGGNDGFYLGAAFDPLDRIDGGAGTLDQVGLQGTYATRITLAADTIRNIETLVFLPGNDTRFALSNGALSAFDIKTDDGNIAAGKTLTVQANTLRSGENLTFDGSAETDGSFLFYAGLGTDVFTGGQKDDGFYFGQGRFGSTDRVDGQGGTADQIGLQGDFAGTSALTFGANQIAGIEAIVVLSGADTRFGGGNALFSYTLTMHDGNAATGGTMIVQGNALRTGEVLTLDASAEGGATYRVFGGASGDTITTGAGNDELWARGGGDVLRGGGGNDIFGYLVTGDSTTSARDRILDFAHGDVIDVSRIGFSQFIGTAAFSGAGQIRAVHNGTAWIVDGDIDGNGSIDLSIEVAGAVDFVWTGTDFRLATPITADAHGLIA